MTGRDPLQLRWLWLLLPNNQPRSPTRLLAQLAPLRPPTATHATDSAAQRHPTRAPWAKREGRESPPKAAASEPTTSDRSHTSFARSQGGSCPVDKNSAICSFHPGGNLSVVPQKYLKACCEAAARTIPATCPTPVQAAGESALACQRPCTCSKTHQESAGPAGKSKERSRSNAHKAAFKLGNS